LPATTNSASGGTLTTGAITSTNNFVNQVDFLNPMSIDWSYSPDYGTNWCTAGTSTNKVYVTLANPTTTNMFHTVVHLACSHGHATTTNDAVANTWALLSGPANVKTWDGKNLYYYRGGCGWSGSATDTAQLLSSASGAGSCAGHGQCGSFANLLIDSIAANGVGSEFVTITTINGDSFIVKDWTFSTTRSYAGDPDGYEYKLTLVNEGGILGMVPAPSGRVYGDLTKQTTLHGQNTAPPSEEWFGAHFIVKYNGLYYDPSYGVTNTGSNNFESLSVEGYARYVSGLDFKVRSASGMHNINFDR
jgi:hypothetical protein